MITSTSNHRQPATPTALRVVLTILGAVSAFVAINVAFGGLDTLGLQGPTDYFRVTDQHAFSIRDSHARYYGGVYLALGMFVIYAARDVRRFGQGLYVVFAMIFAGGLARLTQLDAAATFGTDLLPSTVIELVGIPALALWVAKASSTTNTATAVHPRVAVAA
jgi:hypothetical protein